MLAIVIDFINSPWKFWHVGLSGITIYLALQLAILFIIEGKGSAQELHGRLNFALASAFIIFAINASVKIANNFYFPDMELFERITLIFTSLALGLVITLMESMVRTTRIFTIMSVVTIIFFCFVDIYSVYVWIGFGLIGFSAIFPISFIYSLYKRGGRYLKGRILLLVFSVLIMYLGVAPDLRRIQLQIQYEEWILVAYFLQAAGILGIFSAFREMNIFDETEWEKYVEELYVINKSDLQPLFYQNFRTGIQEMSKETLNLIAGGLIGINDMMKEISDSKSGKKGVSLIEEQGKFIVMEHGQNVMVCFVTKKDLKTLRFFLRKILSVFDKYFYFQLTGWADLKEDIYKTIPQTLSKIFKGKFKEKELK